MFQDTTLRSEAIECLRQKKIEVFERVLPADLFQGLAPAPVPGTVLVPEVVFWLMACVALGDGTMAGAIPAFWCSVNRMYAAAIPLEPLTAAAFCTARAKLSLEFFEGLFLRLQERFDRTFGQRYRWRDFHLVGIDGTLVNPPAGARKLLEVFRPSSNELGAGKHPQALIMGLVDVWSGLCRGFKMTTSKMGEVPAAMTVIPLLDSRDLLLGDRHFACFDVMAGVLERGNQFLMRLQDGRFTGKTYKRRKLGCETA